MPTRSIRAHVAPQTLSKVTRLFNGSLRDILTELLQNARRAGATRVSLITTAHDDGTTDLRILDDGCGVADPAKLLSLGSSGWGDEIAAREDPAGMGVFSLAGHDVRVSSRAARAGFGWSASIAASDWTSGDPIPVTDCLRSGGTTFAFTISKQWSEQLPGAVADVARHYPLPVLLDNERQPHVDFLDKALFITSFAGVRIGVFNDTGHWTQMPALNFHGLTVAHQLPTIQELDTRATWFAKIDIVDCPALQLTLPARKEVVATPFLAELAIAVSTAIYAAIAKRGHHRLSFARWSEAAALGVDLPEATQDLIAFAPTTADTSFARSWPDKRLAGEDLILMGNYDAAEEQTLERALTMSQAAIGRRLVRAEPDLEGYQWYNRLCALEAMRVVVKQGDVIHIIDDSTDDPDLGDGRVDAIAVELGIWQFGAKQVHQLNTDLLLLPNDAYDLDTAVVAIVRDFASGGQPMIPALLSFYLDAAYFVSSDDSDCDSWDTQLRAFQTESRRRALTLLDGAEAATRAAIEDAFRNHVAWLVPTDCCLALTLTGGVLDVAVMPLPDAGIPLTPD